MPHAGPATRVLVIEDEFIIALDLPRQLVEAGYDVAGPAGNTEAALAILEAAPPHVGLLDVNLGGGQNSYAVARRLKARKIPFAFISGYSTPQVSAEFGGVPVLAKPCPFAEVLEMIARLRTGDVTA